MTEIQNPWTFEFEILDLFRISDFVLRIYDRVRLQFNKRLTKWYINSKADIKPDRYA